MSLPTTTRPVAVARAATARIIAIGASLIGAALYLLIGLKVLDIGRPAEGAADDIMTFGVVMAIVSVAIAAVLWRFVARPAWMAVAVVELLVLVGYVMISPQRVPPFELWGLLVKASQLVVLAAVAYLLLHRQDIEAATRHGTQGSAA